MSARQMNNVSHLLIGGTANLSGPSAQIADLAAGEIGAFDAGGLRIVEASATTGEVNVSEGMEFFLALGGSSPLQRTPLMKGSDIKSIAAVAYSAPVEQSQYIGYNGTDGSLEVFDNNLYMVQVYVEDYLNSSHDGRYIKHFQYESDATATQAEVAIGLVGSAVFNWSREAKDVNGDPFMKFEAVCNTAAAATHAFDNTLTITKGSKVITASGADYNGGTVVVAGDFVRIPATDVTAAVGDDVYRVESVSGDNITLDRPVQIASGTRSTTDENQVITAAEGAAADWGIFATGVDKPYSVGKEFHGKVRFTINAKDFGASTMQAVTAADEGVGAVNSVSDLEWFTKGNQGEYFRMGEPTIYSYTSDVDASVTGGGYDFLSIKLERSDVVGFQGNVGPVEVTLATPATAPDFMTNGTDGLRDVLEAIAGTGLIAAAGLDV